MSSQPTENPSVIEKAALRIFEKAPDRKAPVGALTRQQLVAMMKPIENRFIRLGVISGAMCGVVSSLGALLANYLAPAGPSNTLAEQLTFHAIFLGIALSATLIEILLLFQMGVRSAAAIGKLAGVDVSSDLSEQASLKRALVRAGLEIPCRTEPIFGIDPLQERRRVKYLMFTVAYKLKVSATSFVAKALVRRIGARLTGRVLSRAMIELVAVPVFALWNFIVCRLVMRQVRVRALGPQLRDEIFSEVFPAGVASLPSNVQSACYHALRQQVLCVGAFHHNMIMITQRFLDESSLNVEMLGASTFLESLQFLEPETQRWVLEWFCLLCAVDGGRSWRAKKKVLSALKESVSCSVEDKQLERYRQAVFEGISFETVAGVQFGEVTTQS